MIEIGQNLKELLVFIASMSILGWFLYLIYKSNN
jgi:hypothetical protein